MMRRVHPGDPCRCDVFFSQPHDKLAQAQPPIWRPIVKAVLVLAVVAAFLVLCLWVDRCR